MKVSEAIESRISTRAFLDTPVAGATLRRILDVARRSPSGGNLQPWHVWVLGGERLQQFRNLIREKLAASPFGESMEYAIYPPKLKDPYRSRRFRCGEDLYATISVEREDKQGRMEQFAKNFEFFGAPAAMFFAIDRQMGPPQWADVGMFLQSIMLLAREHGLHTCPQEAWAMWPETVRAFVEMPEDLMLFCGLAVGYMDEAHPINTLRTERAPLEEIATFIDI